MKRYNPINISGYHISEAGSSPLHEAAFTLANLIVYVEEVMKTGHAMSTNSRRGSLSSSSARRDFFEEIAKFRALRRCYAKIMKERFGAKNPESMRLRFHCQTAAAIAHQAAIHDQCRAHGDAGALSGAWRLPVAAHQRL